MVAKAVKAWIDPYLDRQLGPAETALFEKTLLDDPAFLVFFQAQKAFHSFVQRSLASVRAPEGLEVRIRARLGLAGSNQEVHPREGSVIGLNRRWWRLSAAVLLACCCLVVYQMLCAPLGACRYVAACTQEHERVVSGALPLGVVSGDRDELCRYAGQQVLPAVERLPELGDYCPAGAGRASFEQLRGLGAPAALFFRYEDAHGRPLLLFVHEWPSESPTVKKVEYNGLQYWFAKYGGVGFVGWKSADGRVLCSLTGDQGKVELLRLAAEARQSTRLQDGLSPTATRPR